MKVQAHAVDDVLVAILWDAANRASNGIDVDSVDCFESTRARPAAVRSMVPLRLELLHQAHYDDLLDELCERLSPEYRVGNSTLTLVPRWMLTSFWSCPWPTSCSSDASAVASASLVSFIQDH